MQISGLHILPTNNTPGILLKPEGFVRIDGRGLIGYNDETSEQILNWIHEYLKNPAELTIIIIALEYINSASAKILVSILKEISEVVQHNKQFFVHWCYEDEDEDILERGEYISTALNIPIDLIRTHYEGNTINEALINKNKVVNFEKERLTLKYSHGTGCTFSTALTCYLGNGLSLKEACVKASEYVNYIYKKYSLLF